MVSVQTAFESIGLEKYTEAFQNLGISSLDELIALTNDQVTTAMTNTNMLKGHTFKLRKFIEDTRVKGFNPTPQPPVQIPVSAPVVTQPITPTVTPHKESISLNGNGTHHVIQPKPPVVQENPEIINPALISSQMESVNKQLNNMTNLHEQVSAALKMIVDIDLSKYKKAIEDIESVQAAIKAHLEKDVEMAQG